MLSPRERERVTITARLHPPKRPLRLPGRRCPSRSTSLPTEAASGAHPEAFGPFRVLHQIGAGALGPVFRAYDPDQDKLVAVKFFRLDLAPERVHKLVAELQALIDADLTHPTIAAPVATGITDVAAYLAQDFVAADAVDSVIRAHGPAPAAVAVRVAMQVAAALDFASGANVAHGALHPRDILVSLDDTRLTGLGITQALERVGIPAPVRRPYTAPERIAGVAWDRRADVFSLAAIIHELLWGRRVTAMGEQAAASLTALEGGDLAALGRLFARALAENPSDRFESASEFADRLRSALPVKQSAVGSQPSAVDGQQSAVGGRQAGDDGYQLAVGGRHLATSGRQATDGPGEEPRLPLGDDQADQLPLGPASSEPEHDFDVAQVFASSRVDVDLPLSGSPEAGRTFAGHADPTRDADAGRTLSGPADNIGSDVGRAVPPSSDTGETMPGPSDAGRSLTGPADAGQTIEDSAVSGRTVDADASRTLSGPAAMSLLGVSESALDRTRSAVWPLTLALGVGLSVGFAIGYAVASRTGPDAAQVAGSAAAPATPASGSAGREVSETEVRLKAEASTAAPIGSGPAGPVPDLSPTKPDVPPEIPLKPDPTSAPSAGAEKASASEIRPKPDPTSATATRATAASRTPPGPTSAPAPAAGRAGRPAPVEGRLVIRSNPSGATAFLDGREVGKTPVNLGELERGTHTVRVTRDGFVAEERRVVLSSSRPSQSLTFELARAKSATAPSPPPSVGGGVGAVSVESRPAGARVLVDGKLIGTTPLTIAEVASGAHTVSLELAGYRRWTTSVKVVAGERSRVAASLER